MKNIFILITGFIIILSTFTPSSGRGHDSTGIVDLTVIKAIHPLNRYFIPEAGIYLKPVEYNEIEDFSNQSYSREESMRSGINLANKEISLIIRKKSVYRRRIKLIEEKVRDNRKNLKNEFTELYSLEETPANKIKLNAIRKQLRLINEQIGYTKATYEAQLVKANERIFQIKENIFSINYLNRTESVNLTKKIDIEIEKALKKVCRKKRLSSAFDISVLRETPETEWEETVEKFWQTSGSEWPNFYYISQEEADFKSEKLSNAIISDYKYRIKNKIREFSKPEYKTLDNFIIFGSTDIHEEIIEELLKKYDYSRQRRQIIIDSVLLFLKERRDKK